MRTVTLLLLVAAPFAASANKLFVVLHTTDAVIVDYVCPQRLDLGSDNAVRRIVVQQGYLTWHATGGVRPYQVLSEETDHVGNVCITVMDAAGQIATGCGIMSTWHYTKQVNCSSLPCDSAKVQYPSKETTCDRAMDRTAREPRPVPRPRIIGERQPAREPGPGTRPAITERPVDRREPGRGTSGSSGVVYKNVSR